MIQTNNLNDLTCIGSCYVLSQTSLLRLGELFQKEFVGSANSGGISIDGHTKSKIRDKLDTKNSSNTKPVSDWAANPSFPSTRTQASLTSVPMHTCTDYQHLGPMEVK